MSMKELKSVDISSYTIISTGISVLFAILTAVILGALILILVPNSFSPMIYITTTIVFGTIICSIVLYFMEGYLYNVLSKSLKYIKLDIDESGYIKNISPTETALMIGAITFLILVVLYFASALFLPIILNSMVTILMYAGQLLFAIMIYNLIFMISNPMTVLIGIAAITIITSIIVFISTYLYNILANSERGVIVNISKEDNYSVLESIDYKTFAIAIAAIGLIISIIFGVITIILMGGAIFAALSSILVGFISCLIEGLLIAVFYNFLAPRIGKLKFELE